MKFRPRLELYTNYNKSNTFDPKTMQAYSYTWWLYVDVIKGKVVFNDYTYSPTTSGHQSEMRYLLSELGINIDLVVEIHGGLQDFKNGALKPLYKTIFQLEIEMNRKGSNKKKNESRLKTIESIKNQIKEVRKLGAVFSKKDQKRLKDFLLKEEEERLERMKNQRQKVKEVSMESKEKLNNLDDIDFLETEMNDLNDL